MECIQNLEGASEFGYSRMAVHNLIKKIKDTGSTERRKGSCRPVTTTTEENASIFEELVCSREDEPDTHNSMGQITPRISISKSSVHRLVKEKDLHCYKCLKTPQMNSACRKRRAERAGKLLQRFSIHSLLRFILQDEKAFPLKYQLIAKTIKFISMVPRKMRNRNASTPKETNFRKRLWYPL